MATDYKELRRLWAETARQAGSLDVWNRALVYNYLASAAEYTAPILNNQGNDRVAAEDARAYAEDMRAQDVFRYGYNLANKWGEILGFGSVVGLLLGGVGGILYVLDEASRQGAEVDLAPLTAKILGTSGVAVWIVRVALGAGQQAGKAITDAWEHMLASADAAKQLIGETLDVAEQSFYSSHGAPTPSRLKLNVAGPGAAIGLMLLIVLVVAPFVVFLFASFGTHPPRARF